MKTFFTTVIIALASVLSVNAEVKEKKFDVKDFSQIEIIGSPKVIYQHGTSCSVKVCAESEYLDKTEAFSDGQTLTVRFIGNSNVSLGFFDLLRAIKNGTTASAGEIIFYVTSPDLTDVKLTGSGDFISKEKVDTDNLTLTLNGSGDIDFQNIICDRISGYVTGSGDLDINRVESITSNFELRGSGDISVTQYEVKKTELSVFGSGDIDVNCNHCDVVNAAVYGSGDISLSGDIKQLNKSTRGSGDIHY